MIENLNNHYKIGDTVLYKGNSKSGNVFKITKRTIKVRYIGYYVTYANIKNIAFLSDLVVINGTF